MPANVPTSDDATANYNALQKSIASVQATCNQILAALQPTPPPIAPPPQAVAAGYTKLTFDEEWTTTPDIGYGTNGHKWYAGLWYEAIPPSSCFQWDGKSVLTIVSPEASQINLCTLSHDTTQGASFQFAYMEAMLQCSNWSAFWFLSTAHAQGKPGTLCSEIDVVETDSGKPGTYWATLHLNTGSYGGVPDQFNQGKGNGNLNPLSPGQVLGQWHKLGMLWTPSLLTAYFDDQPTTTIPPYSSTAQPNFLILDARGGGIVGGPTVPPVTTAIDWVRVWQSP